MLKQLHRLHLNYPEEVVGQLSDHQSADDNVTKAVEIAHKALKEFRRDCAREALELSPGSLQIKQQVGWAVGRDTMFDPLTF